ncbi:hypothetical protein B5M43_014335 [Microbacterium sp. MEC084]|uniref:hypothetical protein n=1 Tax=Microbacterium sp. MEC084 TaxID=1963027 RepID=UPI001E3BF64B|nr:hypothetical protein [Microbacterium sp. MEC084]MCD1269993.1 hypothetical protein [Microbacterium sp. MEC084]
MNRPRFDAASFRVWKEDDDHAEEDSGGDEAARYPARAQYTALRYSERLADVGAIASIGTVGDSYDCQSVSAASRKDEEVLAGAF